MEMQAILMIFVYVAPMAGLVIWAFATMHPRYCTEKTLFLRNRAVAVGIITMCLVAVIVLITWQAFELGWCNSGLLSPVECSDLPDEIGRYLFIIYFPGAVYLVAVCLPALLLFAIAEWITRRKFRNHLEENAAG
ncbi:hypothetical protein [Profundibacter sp.]|uniref:hypothetical protein n=1 Tax=Profundibacter sp. TaxID=3101071 RepID=UPI003D1049C9